MSVVLTIIEALFTSGATLYAVVRNRLNGQVWNGTAFEAYNSAHWSLYAIALTEQTSSGYYIATRPAGLVGFLTSESIYQQGGGSPTLGDTPATNLAYSGGDNVLGISGDAAVPSDLQAGLITQQIAAVSAGSISAQSFPTTLIDTLLNLYQGRILLMTSGAAFKSAAVISGYNPTSGVITLSGGLASAPSPGDSFVIV